MKNSLVLKGTKYKVATASATAGLALVAALIATGAVEGSPGASEIGTGIEHALEYSVSVDWPLSPQYQNTVQLVTVYRGGSVSVPVQITGSATASGTGISVVLAAEDAGKLDDAGHVQGQPPFVPPQGVKITFSQPQV